MDSSVKIKDLNCNGPPAVFCQTASAIANICDSIGMLPPPHHELVSANSIELNAAASLSDDSGVPLTTNSSISSGDSYRLGMCKFEIEMIESDGEVSQFDSLDNCSEGGMSAENFNTLKKGPLAPIDPPPEFQDSPQKTLVRSISKNVVHGLRRWTSSQSSFEHLKDNGCSDIPKNEQSISDTEGLIYLDDDRTLKESYAINKHLYSSDSILNSHGDNIYDEPNNIISCSVGNSVDIIESDSSSPLPPPPPPVSIVKIKQILCPYYQDHTRYFKAIPSEQDNITAASQRFHVSGLSEIHDYDLYYGAKRTTYQQHENSLQRKLLYSPLNYSHHYHNNHYHTGVSLYNRPNSRNSLNSRLSSSHNSLSVSSSNKPDDSIFITQAMSHDALLTREISDFYNVPIDSDIYAFPVDMIQSEKDCIFYKQDASILSDKNSKQIKQLKYNSTEHSIKCQYKSNRKNNRNKRKKRPDTNWVHDNEFCKKQNHQVIASKTNYREAFDYNGTESGVRCDDQTSQEPLHMSLDEVKQFYHTLYSDTKSVTTLPHGQNSSKTNTTKSSNETIWSASSTRLRVNNGTVKDKNLTNNKSNIKVTQKSSLDNDNINNNNLSSHNNHNNQQNIQPHGSQLIHPDHSHHTHQLSIQYNANNKQSMPNDKKSQFTLNLKQKFCSIFRFRKSHNRFRTNTLEAEENSTTREQNFGVMHSGEDKRNKFQSRALPPLPKKVDSLPEVYENKENKKPDIRSFQFTSSIEKVKDYGWYWGPLSSEAAEKVLSNESDGSFIVRDSSDDHYIFSLSFKLNNCVRHVRIEQDQGTFSFGSYAKFKSQTITEFIEKAVEHSRSGRYLFFLHRRPEHGPMRVQLTNPVSRFKHVQSLQHMCRFVILKAVIRKDLIQTLPLPRRLLDYLNYKHCYSEQVESDSSHSQISGEGSI